MKKNIIMIDCEETGLEDFKDGLSAETGMKFDWYKLVANGIRTGKVSEIKRYVKYFVAPFKVFMKRKSYGMIIGWQQFYALIFCFYCSLFHVKKTNCVVAVNFTYKQKSGGGYIPDLQVVHA